MIGEPPSDAGAVQDTVACPSPATAVTLVGAPGTDTAAASGVTPLLAEDAALVPTLLVAVTVKVYADPLVRPVTVQVSVEPLAEQDLVLSSTAVAV